MPVGGLHVIVDAECTRNLADVRVAYDFLHRVADLAGMEVMGSQMHELPTGVPTGPGVTGSVHIKTSHGTVHTFPETGRMSFDFYSCTKYEAQDVLDAFNETFGALEPYLGYWELRRAPMLPEQLQGTG